MIPTQQRVYIVVVQDTPTSRRAPFMQIHDRDSRARRRHQTGSPHLPLIIAPIGEEKHVARCLVCGLCGPERADAAEAKLAFDEAAKAWRRPWSHAHRGA